MGGFVTKAVLEPQNVANNVRALIGMKRRRDESDDADSDTDSMLEKTLHTPKRKKLMSTAQYIYRALFKEGNNSDVTVIALEKHWRLHKLYLSQNCISYLTRSSPSLSPGWKTVNVVTPTEEFQFGETHQQFEKGNWLLVTYSEQQSPGEVTQVLGSEVEVSVMVQHRGTKQWKWPAQEDKVYYTQNNIIRKIKPPEIANSRRFYYFPDLV